MTQQNPKEGWIKKTTQWMMKVISWVKLNVLILFDDSVDGVKGFWDILKRFSKAIGESILEIVKKSYKYLAKKLANRFSRFKLFLKKSWRKIIFILASVTILVIFVLGVVYGATWLWNSANNDDSVRRTVTPLSIGIFVGFFIFLILTVRFIIRKYRPANPKSVDKKTSKNSEDKKAPDYYDRLYEKEVKERDRLEARRSGFWYAVFGIQIGFFGRVIATVFLVLVLLPAFGQIVGGILVILGVFLDMFKNSM